MPLKHCTSFHSLPGVPLASDHDSYNVYNDPSQFVFCIWSCKSVEPEAEVETKAGYVVPGKPGNRRVDTDNIDTCNPGLGSLDIGRLGPGIPDKVNVAWQRIVELEVSIHA